MKSDASAAVAIANRRGFGKVRHIEVCQLWLQDKVRRGEIRIVKVGTHENLADALTKALDGPGVKKHLDLTRQQVMSGRHRLTPKFQSDDFESQMDLTPDIMAISTGPKFIPKEDAVRLFRLYNVGDLMSLERVVKLVNVD